ncbi:MAG: hypothetical protein JST73_07280 [Actinobacteria bacterium]|nr:hypothetical protein [Actinomycetota bacterium]
MTDLEPSLPERMVNKLAATLDRSRPRRRSFLAGVAVAGSALALKPWGFLVEDAAAYDVVCGDGNLCADGWSAFCCTVGGTNSCPPGSFTGGWWKADNSGFCCGSARYYIDCNAACGSGWQCHCASGTCDQRRVACNQFRYGQCNQEISCYGPVVCRVVTCQPPWQWDGSCTTSSATDNNTASHNAPCQINDCNTPIDALWNAMGGAGGVLGGPLTGQQSAAPCGVQVLYANGAIFQNGSAVNEIHGRNWSIYTLMGAQTGPLGCPISSTLTGADGVTTYNLFASGIIIAPRNNGPYELNGSIFAKWQALNSESGPLGYPASSIQTAPDGYTPYALFDTGIVFARIGKGTFEVHGAILTKWNALGGVAGFGMPTTDTTTGIDGTTRYSMFDWGGIFYRPNLGTFEIHGDIRNKWVAIGGASVLGYPIGDTATDDSGMRYSSFDRGRIVYDPTTQATNVIMRAFK